MFFKRFTKYLPMKIDMIYKISWTLPNYQKQNNKHWFPSSGKFSENFPRFFIYFTNDFPTFLSNILLRIGWVDWYLLSLMHQTLLSFNTPTFISLTHTNLLFFPIFSYRFSIFPCELIIYTWIKTYWICRAIARHKLPNKNNKFLGSSALRSIIKPNLLHLFWSV